MEEINILRNYIRNVLRNIKKIQRENLRKEINEEYSTRRMVRKLLREKQITSQHNSTGINALESLLSSIVPILESGYKSLKTDEKQRASFKAHILRAIQNLLSTASVYFSADKKAAGGVQPLAIPPQQSLKEQAGTPENDPAFIDVDKNAKQEKPNPIDAFQTVQGEDLTGRNFALETFKKIQKQILETYSLLSNEEDREVFYDYLITNVKLYFDKFETELEATPAEPTTPEYEAEKSKIAASLQQPAPGAASAGLPAPEVSEPTSETPPA